MPASLADTGDSEFAQAHLDLVGDDNRRQHVGAVFARVFPGRERRRYDVARVRRVLHPVDIVIVHYADQKTVDERRLDQRSLLAGPDDGRVVVATEKLEYPPVHFGVFLLQTAQCATHTVKYEPFRRRTRVLGDLIVSEVHGEFGESLCHRGHKRVSLVRRKTR